MKKTKPERDAVVQQRLVLRLIDLLTDPTQEWRFGEHTATHPSGMELWIANMPILDLNTYPVKSSFTLWDKYRIWKAMKTARNYWALRVLSQNACRDSSPSGD